MFNRITRLYRSQPKFQFAFNSKPTPKVKELQKQIVQLRTLQNESNAIKEKFQYYNEIFCLHEQIVRNQQGICIEQLLDRLRLFILYTNQDKQIEQNDLQELKELDLNQIHYDNIIEDDLTENIKEYYRNLVNRLVNQLRIIHSLNQEPVEKLQYWCEQFREAVEGIFDYQTSQLNEIEDKIEISMCEEFKYQYMSIYHNPLAQIAHNRNNTQETIDQYEKSIEFLQNAIKIDKRVMENNENSEIVNYAGSQLQSQYKQLAYELNALSDIKMEMGIKTEAQILKTQAQELFLLTTGNQSIEYVITTCSQSQYLLGKDNFIKAYQMIENLYEQIRYSENRELVLQISLSYFCYNNEELRIIIEDLLQDKVRIHDKNPLIDYYSIMIEITANQFKMDLTQMYMEKIVEALESFRDISAIRYIISMIVKCKDIKVPNPNRFYELSLQILENQQFRFHLLTDQVLDDEKIIMLLRQVEYFILYFKLQLRNIKQIKVETIVSDFLTYVNTFQKYEKQFPLLMDSIIEFLDLLKYQKKQRDQELRIINYVNSILNCKQSSILIDSYRRHLKDAEMWSYG